MALSKRRIADVVMLRTLGRKAFLQLPNVGAASADEIERLIGWERITPTPKEIKAAHALYASFQPDDDFDELAAKLHTVVDGLKRLITTIELALAEIKGLTE